MEFPKNLVGYEIAIERAFRMLLGSRMDTHHLPDHDAVADAFFEKREPAEFARQWLAEEKYRLSPDDAVAEGEGEQNDPFNPQEEELF